MIKMEHKIEEITKQVISLSDQTLLALEESMKNEIFTENEVFITLNEPNESEYFIYEGICRSFLYTSSGAEVTLQFFMEKSVLSPNIIRTEDNLSNQNVQAITNVTGFSINKNKFRSLMNQFKDLEMFAHMSVQRELKKLAKGGQNTDFTNISNNCVLTPIVFSSVLLFQEIRCSMLSVYNICHACLWEKSLDS